MGRDALKPLVSFALISTEAFCRRIALIRDSAQPLAFGASTFAFRMLGNNGVAAMIARMDSVRTFHQQSKGSFSHTIGAAKNQFFKPRHAQT